MARRVRRAVPLALVAAAVLLCAMWRVRTYGGRARKVLTVEEVIRHADALEGSTVTVKGAAGDGAAWGGDACWFLMGGTQRLWVRSGDLPPRGAPQIVRGRLTRLFEADGLGMRLEGPLLLDATDPGAEREPEARAPIRR